MMFCGKCGAENPDDFSFCSNCGAPLVKSKAPENRGEKITPAAGHNTPEPEKKKTAGELRREAMLADPDIESIDDSMRDPVKGEYVSLKRTSSRCSARLYSQLFSWIGTAVSLVAVFLVKIDYKVSLLKDGPVVDYRSVTILEVAKMNADLGTYIYIAFGVIILFGMLGILSASFGSFSIFGYMALTVMVMFPFNNSQSYNLGYYMVNDFPVIILIMMIVIGILFIISDIFMRRCLNKNGRYIDSETAIRYHGLLFNIDVEWFKVWRKS